MFCVPRGLNPDCPGGETLEPNIFKGTRAVAENGDSVNGFYLGIYGLCSGLSTIGLIGGAWQLLIYMVGLTHTLNCFLFIPEPGAWELSQKPSG